MPAPRFRPQLTALDDRIVPAISVTQSGNNVTISSVPGATRGAILVVHDPSNNRVLTISEVGGATVAVPIGSFRNDIWNTLTVNLTSDAIDDIVDIRFLDGFVVNVPRFSVTVSSGDGNDRVVVQEGQNKYGNVLISTGGGNDSVFVVANVTGWLAIQGGSGQDSAQVEGNIGWQSSGGGTFQNLEQLSFLDFRLDPDRNTFLNNVYIENLESVPTVRVSARTHMDQLVVFAPSVTLDFQGDLRGLMQVNVPDFTVIGDAVAPERLADVTIRGRVGTDLTVDALNTQVNVTGTVVGSVRTNTTPRQLPSATNRVTVATGGVVEGGVTVGQSNLSGGQAVMTVQGTVGGSLAVYGSGLSDVLLVAAGGRVGGGTTVRFAGGRDTVLVNGVVGGNAGSQSADIRTGAGDDWVEIGSSAVLDSTAVLLEDGNDVFVLRTGATFAGLIAGGGAGTDSFFGVRTLPSLFVSSFEVFGPA